MTKDLSNDDQARIDALSRLDKTCVLEIDLVAQEPSGTFDRKFGVKGRISLGVVATSPTYSDFMHAVKQMFGDRGQWIFKNILCENYGPIDGTMKLQRLYDKFRRDVLGPDYEEWT